MGEVGIRALKQNASQVVAVAAAGESVTITDRGRPVARLVPLGGGRLAALVESGRARAPRRGLSDLPPRRPVKVDVGAELRRARADERY
ncbi:type II toxin-antitoxin system Phd/YefM family antitoxin [Agromyces albus]|uniref:Antitoxin n=1 Tax=Agromyces albus TaxID=205332 RepID=A0A4Q2L2N2_9MICO|nr:type II toxin-antitoxin system prevent-host-death family antitoxin [Agromyces albus]RXZ72375.1 type II toxin-antitoxin system prevent-host-death family antitoxin [Agromyces albus]